jgi:hypothetical protein
MKTVPTKILLCAMSCFTGFAAFAYPSTYNVIYDRISLTVNPASSAAITSGSVTTYFNTTAPALAQIGFDLDQAMNVTSIFYHGSALPAADYSHTANVLLIKFPAAIAVDGTRDSVTINYNGTPVTPTTSIPSGYNRAQHSSGNYIIYTLSESFTGHDWWPCKDSLVDKIDSGVDMIVTTPTGYMVGGNGVLTTTTSGSTLISTWKTRVPIATYLVNFSVANYQDYVFTVNTGLTTPTALPVHNFLFPEGNTAANQNTLNVIQSLIPAYANLLSTDYPYLKEKYGTAECTNFGGALEVQTMTFVASGAYSASILAHELAHQWFGDKLTTNDWHMIWLNEGFAEYFQYVIYPQLLQSTSAALSSRQGLKNSVTNTSTTIVSNITNVDNIFIPSSSLNQPYEKGAMTLSMLRAWLGDNNFFTALYNYVNAPGLAYNFTSVDSLKYYMQQQVQGLGFNLTNFFQEWVNNQGRVTYVVNYAYQNNGIYLNLVQSPTVAGQGHFDMPVPIEIKGSNGLDTTVVLIDEGGKLYNSATGASFGSVAHFNLSGTPSSMTFDPNSVVLATASFNSMSILPVMDIHLQAAPGAGVNLLSWNVTTDLPLQTFVIEKSTDGTHFSSIGSQGAVASAEGQYLGSFTDPDPGEGAVFYRILALEQGGGQTYSAIAEVAGAAGQGALTILPNPSTGSFSLSIPATYSDNLPSNLVIYDASGKVVKMEQISGGTPVISCDDWAPGMYLVLLINDKNQRLYQKMIKK